ncbi:MAG: MFS transporter [Chitinophagaceae bacterium]
MKTNTFTHYERFIIIALTIIQFTVILDFMVLSPLGPILMKDLDTNTQQFGLLVSVYAFTAFGSGIFSAGFADRFDRKKYLLFFYTGFMAATAFCAIANTNQTLLFARILTGLFGGVISSISFAIITDLFKVEVRGRVMGFIQMAFAASQILGIPIGLWLAKHYGWHSSFWLIVGFGIPLGLLIVVFMKPVNAHLKLKSDNKAFQHLINTVKNKEHLRAFAASILLATGGYIMIPFGTAFSTGNLGLTLDQLPFLFGLTGVSTIVFGPMIGKLSDTIGRFKVFMGGSILATIIVLIYTNLGITPFWLCVVFNIVMFMGITARMISTSALISVVPKPQDRGAFMSINASFQQLAGGVSSAIAGMIVSKRADGFIENYPILGFVVTVIMAISVVLVWRLDNFIKKREQKS